MELVQKHYVFATPIFVAVGILRARLPYSNNGAIKFFTKCDNPSYSSHPFFPLDVDVYHIEL